MGQALAGVGGGMARGYEYRSRRAVVVADDGDEVMVVADKEKKERRSLSTKF